ncbi:MAG TPA: hypothetical protein VIV60_32340 [Polyangiaceae bacterium]
MRSLKDSELLRVNVQPVKAAAQVRSALPQLLGLRAEIAYELVRFDLTNLDKLETYALAVIQAHTVFAGIESTSGELDELSNEAISLRARLLNDLKTLVARGHISVARLTGLRGPNGYCNIASDLLTIANVMHDQWDGISSMTATTEDDLARAESLGDRILGLVSNRKKQTEQAKRAAYERQRAFTLLMRAYGQVCRAVRYLRWEKRDANILAPSIYIRKLRRHESAEDAANELASPEAAKSEPRAISDNDSLQMSESLTVNTERQHAASKRKPSKARLK